QEVFKSVRLRDPVQQQRKRGQRQDDAGGADERGAATFFQPALQGRAAMPALHTLPMNRCAGAGRPRPRCGLNIESGERDLTGAGALVIRAALERLRAAEAARGLSLLAHLAVRLFLARPGIADIDTARRELKAAMRGRACEIRAPGRESGLAGARAPLLRVLRRGLASGAGS